MTIQNKIARICWNTYEWKMPSGSAGKSVDTKCFENMRGYGHEEWLNDHSMLINGWKYSFLQPVNTKNKKHSGQSYSIWLYTLRDKKKYCIGKISQVECLKREEAQMALDVHQERGWLNKMKEQLQNLNIDTSKLIDHDSLNNFNIKFKPEDLEWFDQEIDITAQCRNNRYVLLNLIDPHFEKNYYIDDDLTQDLIDLIDDSDLTHTERETLVMARVGQGLFRQSVVDTWGGLQCALTLTDTPELLIASHIKAWKDCETNKERLDGANGIMLCAHVDKLFDRHLLTFIPDSRGEYKSVISKKIYRNKLERIGIDSGYPLNISNLTLDDKARFEQYMQKHNELFREREHN